METQDEKQPSADSSAQAADLAGLMQMAGGEGGEQAGAVATSPGIDPAQAWATLPQTFGGIICMALPELAPVYSAENCLAWGQTMVPVAEKYGWDHETIMGPELLLAASTFGMFALPTISAIQRRRAMTPRPQPARTAAPTDTAAPAAPGEGGGSDAVLDALAGESVPPVVE